MPNFPLLVTQENLVMIIFETTLALNFPRTASISERLVAPTCNWRFHAVTWFEWSS